MKLLVDRKYKKENYTISNLYIDGKYFCNTIEDTDRGLTQNMPLSEIKARKVASKTAIPTGTYKVTLDGTISAREFLDKYEVLSKEGEIFTVREIELD